MKHLSKIFVEKFLSQGECARERRLLSRALALLAVLVGVCWHGHASAAPPDDAVAGGGVPAERSAEDRAIPYARVLRTTEWRELERQAERISEEQASRRQRRAALALSAPSRMPSVLPSSVMAGASFVCVLDVDAQTLEAMRAENVDILLCDRRSPVCDPGLGPGSGYRLPAQSIEPSSSAAVDRVTVQVRTTAPSGVRALRPGKYRVEPRLRSAGGDLSLLEENVSISLTILGAPRLERGSLDSLFPRSTSSPAE